MIVRSRDYKDGYFPNLTSEYLGEEIYHKLMSKYPVLKHINKEFRRNCSKVESYKYLYEPDVKCEILVIFNSKEK